MIAGPREVCPDGERAELDSASTRGYNDFPGPAHSEPMCRFVVLVLDATTDPDFAHGALAGSGRRPDVLCRCVNAAFVLSHDFRQDVELSLLR